MSDLDPSTLAPGIRRLVMALRESGFTTTDSGDGVANVAIGMECALDRPNVAIQVEPRHLVTEADRLLEWLARHGLDVEPLGPEGDAPHIDASYCPSSEVAIILLIGVDDRMLWP